ncbi:MAG: hypothetical protein A4E49_01772 [Methanosaeta sp. PtaU1.Bin112]|nr:MAG: hypothetical protein A4E49_01772 [Methanosaeta sp. PtaU1.Bin112]
MRFNCLCLCIMTLILVAGAASAIGEQGFSLQQSIGMTGGAFSEEYVNSLFGIGGADTDLSVPWFGPEFENTSSASSFLAEFFIDTSVPVVGFSPVKFDVTHKMPTHIYFGSGKEISYTQYQSAIAASRGNELWIQKGMDWTAYAIVPAGTGLQFVVFAPSGGQADYYEITQTDAVNVASKRVDFFAGYNSLNYLADKVGRHILLFVQNNQPSNTIIIDVISQAPPSSQTPASSQASAASQMPPSSNMQTASYPPASNQPYAGQMTTGGLGQTTTAVTSYQTYGTSYPPQTTAAGDTPVTIQTTIRGYDVYVDGVMIGKEGSNGDAADGIFRFSVVGGMKHTIRIFDGMNNYERTMDFPRGVAKIINVPPATTVYTTTMPI